MIHRTSIIYLLVATTRTECFTTTSTNIRRNHNSQTKLRADGSNGVELISLESLGDDHEAVGANMGKSLALWLDEEWIPQEVHQKMGSSVTKTYIECRTKGVDDVSAIMTQVTDDLYENWSEYNADAFVNAWDIGNYIADYLIAKSGSETCGCSAKIVE